MTASAVKSRPTRARKPVTRTVEKPDPVRAKDLAEALSDALLFASRDPYVPIINAVRFESDGSTLTLVATDRYALGIRTITAPSEPFEFVLPYADTQDLIGLLKTRWHSHKRGPEVSLQVENGVLTVATANLSVRYDQAIGEFPKWQKLADQIKSNKAKPDVGDFAVNPLLLAKFARVSTVGPTSPLSIKTTGVSDGVQVRAGKHFWGALMPVRLSERPDEVAA